MDASARAPDAGRVRASLPGLLGRMTHRTILRLQRPIDDLRSWNAKAYLTRKGVKCGPRLRMRSRPMCIRHPLATIEIGADVQIFNKLSENPAGVSHRTVLAANCARATLKIGDHVGISGAVLWCANSITIEDFVNIGADSCIYDTDFHPIQSGPRRAHDHNAVATAPVRICRDAWLGARTIILKGVTVGPRSVVAAGAVVTKDVPPDSIVAGVPARVVAGISPQITLSAGE